MTAGMAWWQSDPEEATGRDKHDTDPPLPRRPPVRVLGDPTDDASLPIPWNGRAA